MKNDLITHRWNKFLKESEKYNLPIKIYIAYFVLTINGAIVDSGVVANMIRSIPNVTTVSKDTIGDERKDFFKALYNIKFVLEPHEDINTYVVKVLKRGIHQINGVIINSFRGIDYIDQGK